MILTRRLMLAGLAAVLAAGAANASAVTPYDAAAFAAAQEAGKPVLLHITAPWCGTCKAQKPTISQLGNQPDFAEMQFLEIDFDTSGDLLRSLNVQSQATMIVYKGKTETGRTVGETDPAAIEALLRTAM